MAANKLDWSAQRDTVDKMVELNPEVVFGTFKAGPYYLEWCGSAAGESLKLPEGWRYSRKKGQIIGPPGFNFYYRRDPRCRWQ